MCRQSWQFNTKRVRFLLRSHGVSGEVDKRAPLGLPTLDRAAVSGGGGPPCPIVPQVSLFFSNALLTPLLLTKELCSCFLSRGRASPTPVPGLRKTTTTIGCSLDDCFEGGGSARKRRLATGGWLYILHKKKICLEGMAGLANAPTFGKPQ
jgi:hypothetical protein